jgi:hypothetical protein
MAVSKSNSFVSIFLRVPLAPPPTGRTVCNRTDSGVLFSLLFSSFCSKELLAFIDGKALTGKY